MRKPTVKEALIIAATLYMLVLTMLPRGVWTIAN